VALVNNAQREHLEFMATVEAVARENGAVIASLDASGIAVFPADDDYTALWRELAGARQVLTFALSGPADVTANARWGADCWQVKAQTPSGSIDFSLHIAGRHNVKNALAAVACALAAGVPTSFIASGLSAFVPVSGRSRAIPLAVPAQPGQPGRMLTLIDDSYNANPDSMRAAIEVLAELPGPRLLVMGDMGEVGDQGSQFHDEAGQHARALGVEKLFTLGAQSERAALAFGRGRHFNAMDELLAAVVAELPYLGSVLVKGSRFMKMERVVHALSGLADDHANPQTEEHKKEPHAA
jgi:UDP-N-acetylmuramoyl-tripeptide--D-alanyl-D-alanine ligase